MSCLFVLLSERPHSQGYEQNASEHRHRRWTTIERKSKTVCHFPYPVPWHLEDVQAGTGIILDSGGSKISVSLSPTAHCMSELKSSVFNNDVIPSYVDMCC